MYVSITYLVSIHFLQCDFTWMTKHSQVYGSLVIQIIGKFNANTCYVSCVMTWSYSNNNDSVQVHMDTRIMFFLQQLKEVLSSVNEDETVISSSTISNPVSVCLAVREMITSLQFQLQTMHYLELLANALCHHELHGLALPVVHLQILLAECIVRWKPLKQLAHLRCVYSLIELSTMYLHWHVHVIQLTAFLMIRMATLCQDIMAHSGSTSHRNDAGNLFLLPEDLSRSACDCSIHTILAHW